MPWPTPTAAECRANPGSVVAMPSGPNLGKPACRYLDASRTPRHALLSLSGLTMSDKMRLTWEATKLLAAREWEGVKADATGATRVITRSGTELTKAVATGAAAGIAEGATGSNIAGAQDGSGASWTKRLLGFDGGTIVVAVVVIVAVILYTNQGGALIRAARR